MNSYINKLYVLSLIVSGSIFLSAISCKKLAVVDPPISAVNGLTVFASDANAISTITGLYANMSKIGFATGNISISYLCGLSADELGLYTGVTSSFQSYYYYRNQLSTIPSYGSDFWSLYKYIYVCNAAIEGLPASTSLNTTVRQQLLGEAKFMRAFYYFYLVNLFGDVPLVMSSDFSMNVSLSRTPKTQVWQQIIIDLKDAQGLLSGGYLDATLLKTTVVRLRPTRWAATALLARVYLYSGDYNNAEIQASSVISNSSMYGLTALTSGVFQKNSNEAIWQIQPTVAGHNTEDAFLFQLPSTGPSLVNPTFLSASLLSSFEASDLRRLNRNWIDSIKIGSTIYYFPYKYRANTYTAVNGVYPAPTEHLMVLRLGEQYLIRSEARVRLNNVSGAQSDLNMIRSRAGLSNITVSTQTDLLAAVQHERQVELFTEWGHRWLDLKRSGTVDNVMNIATPNKTSNLVNWDTKQQLYPLPPSEILYDINLIQNPGYQ